VSITAASEPSIEEVLLGAIRGLPKVHLHNPVLAVEVGDDFMKFFHQADRGEIDNFVLVLEGSIPNEKISGDGYWAAYGNDPRTGQPIRTTEWIDRLAPKALAVVAAGTCATYGGIHAMQGNPTGCMGLQDYLRRDWKSKAGLPIVNVPGCPVQPDNFMETLLYLLDLRRQPRYLLRLRPEHGLRHKATKHRRVDHQSRRSCRIHVRPQYLSGQSGPSLWDKAQNTPSPHSADYGYRTIGDIMTALNPFTGDFYRETLLVSRYTREMFSLMEGRHVHPSTLHPGGVGTVPSVQLFTEYMTRLLRYVEFMKKSLPLHDDLFDFFYKALPGYEEVGKRRILLGCWGA
jgi:hypothetical protein